MRYKVLIVGLGRIGMGYDYNDKPSEKITTLSTAFSNHEKFELVGGVDVDSKKRFKFTKKFNKPSFNNIELAIQITKPDVFVVASPTETHSKIIKEALALRKFKLILCEKPISYSLKETTEIIRLTKKFKIPLFVNYMRRSDPGLMKVRQMIKKQTFKGPYKGICWYTDGIFNNGSHFIDLLKFWFGTVTNFKAIQKQQNNNLFLKDLDFNPDFEINFSSAKFYFLSLNKENFSHNALELYGKNGRLRYERGLIEFQKSKLDKNFRGYSFIEKKINTIKSGHPFLQWHLADNIYKFLTKKNFSLSSSEDSYNTIRLLDKVRRKFYEIR